MGKKLMLLALLFSAKIVSAQQDTTTLDEVVVTANKMAQKQSTTGKVVTVITKSDLEKMGNKNLATLLQEQVGVTVNGSSNNPGSVQTIFTRGASGGRTLVLLDGIPVNDPSFINNDLDLNLFATSSIERIEICRGAQSTLYGSDAIAGVINIITTSKDISRPIQINASSLLGSFGTQKNNLQLAGKKNKWSYSGRIAHTNSKGFSAANDSTGKNNFDADYYKGLALHGQINYAASEHFSVKAFSMYNKYKAGVDAGVFKDDRDFTIQNSSLLLGTGFVYKKNNFQITGTYQHNQLDRHFLNDSAHKTSTWYEKNDYTAASDYAEMYTSVKLSNRLTALLGLDYRKGSYSQDYFSISQWGPYSFNDPIRYAEQSALYGSLLYTSENKKLTLEVGGRANKHSVYGNNQTFTLNPSFALSANTRIFASVSSGFKAPSLYQISINDKLDPEKATSYEAGFSYQNKTLQTRLVYFNRQTANGIDYNYINYQYFNYVKQAVNGLEFEIKKSYTNGVTAFANYTFLAGKETTQNRITNQDTITYDYLLRRPTHQLNIGCSVQINTKLRVDISGRYASKRYDVGGYAAPDILLKSYATLAANVGYQLNKHWRFTADIQNFTNTKYYEVYGFTTMPLNASIGAVLNW
ncbi:MAG: TonB-dependent receptor [Bacteroidetes bacterium]|nr:TonB-dependent receptor [Bacteroidota bacterium]